MVLDRVVQLLPVQVRAARAVTAMFSVPAPAVQPDGRLLSHPLADELAGLGLPKRALFSTTIANLAMSSGQPDGSSEPPNEARLNTERGAPEHRTRRASTQDEARRVGFRSGNACETFGNGPA